MAVTQIRGTTQIMAGTVPWSAMAAGAIVPISSIVNGSQILLSTGAVAMAAALNLGGFTAQNSGAPVNASDLVTKAYVDAKVGGIGGIHDVRALGAANISLAAPGAALDGVTLAANDLILLTAQTTASQNGPWVWNGASSALTRPTWWASASTVNEGQYFLVAEGTAYKDTKFWCTTTGTITVDTTSTAFTQDQSGVSYTNGTGLSLAGNVFSVTFGTTSGTVAQGNDSRITGALQTSALGTGIATALGIAVGTAGAPVINGGALGTPSGGTLTSCTGLPIGGLTGLGTGIAAALAVNSGAANGLPVLATGGVLAAANFPALSGDVTTVAGSLVSTINNTAGSGFIKYTNEVTNETPTGTVNGVNTAFTLANTPATGFGGTSTLSLYLNGQLMDPGNDYTLSGTSITMISVPQTGDKLRAGYLK